MEEEDRTLSQEITALRRELERLNTHRFIRQMNSPSRMLGAVFVRGMVLGLGTVVGATILVSLIAYLLAQVDFIPILGQWAARIAEEIRQH